MPHMLTQTDTQTQARRYLHAFSQAETDLAHSDVGFHRFFTISARLQANISKMTSDSTCRLFNPVFIDVMLTIVK